MQTDLYKYKTEPFTHQVNAVKFVSEHCMFDNEIYFALFMEQGTGKTKTTIDILENLYLANKINRVLIIAPNGVHRQWGKDNGGEIVKHGFVPSRRFVWSSSKAMEKKFLSFMDQPTTTLTYFCVNVEAFSVTSYLQLFKNYVKGGRTFVVIDEATSIKNPTANRTANIIDGLSDCVRAGKRLLSRSPCSVGRAILTGTPEAKGPYGLWSMFDFLKQNYFGINYYAFKAKYGMERTVYFPGLLRPVKKPLEPSDFKAVRKKASEEEMKPEEIAIDMSMALGDVQYILDNPDILTPYKNLADLKEKVNKVAYTVKKEDCLDLPEKVYETRTVPMSVEQKRIYNDMKKYAWSVYEKGALDAMNQVAIRTRLRQIAGGFFPTKYDLSEGTEQELAEIASTPIGVPPKYTAIEQMLEDNEYFPVIITTAFKAEANYLYDNLSKKYKCGLITGAVDKKLRPQIEDAFVKNELQILIATEGTIAKGYNFQNASVIYMYSSTYSSEDRMQLEDRIHRMGQKRTCVYVDLLTENSVDEGVLKVVQGDVAFQHYMRSDDPSDFFKLINYEE